MNDCLMNNTYDHLSVECAEKVLRVTIERPEKLNAMSRDTLRQLHDAFTRYRDAESIVLAILTGAGEKCFTAGGDLKDLDAVRTVEQTRAMAALGKQALDAIRNFPVPVVAALNGAALGGGAELAMACDFRVAAGTAQIGFIQGKLNITTAWGGGADLIERIGAAQALYLLGSCRLLDAGEALRLGVIDACCRGDETLEQCLDNFITPWLARRAATVRGYKALRNRARDNITQPLSELETDTFIQRWLHDDHWQAAAAVLNRKR